MLWLKKRVVTVRSRLTNKTSKVTWYAVPQENQTKEDGVHNTQRGVFPGFHCVEKDCTGKTDKEKCAAAKPPLSFSQVNMILFSEGKVPSTQATASTDNLFKHGETCTGTLHAIRIRIT